MRGYNKIIAHKPEGEWGKIAPVRILSFGTASRLPISLSLFSLQCA
jgi:hypothetical protein